MTFAPLEARYSTPAALVTLPDRKSTRLNSSHLVISYAVFCLKKKKKSVTVLLLSQLLIYPIFGHVGYARDTLRPALVSLVAEYAALLRPGHSDRACDYVAAPL